MKQINRILKWILFALAAAGGLLVLWFFAFVLATDETTKYKQDIQECYKARENGNPKSITRFLCPEGKVQTAYDVGYQVVLDEEFKKLDQEVLMALRGFQGQNIKDPVTINKKLVDWFDETSPNSQGSFSVKYRKICDDLSDPGNPLRNMIAAESAVSSEGAAGEFLYGSSSCHLLVTQKMNAFRDIGYLIGVKDVTQSYTNDKDKFVDKLNQNYQNLLMQWTIYIGELSRIKSKWNIKTKIQNGA